jgi:hypothetical protein
VTMARRVPVKRLNNVDLPTLGRPTITSEGKFWAMNNFELRKTVAGRSCEIVARAGIAQNRSRTRINCTASPRQSKTAYELSTSCGMV